MPVNREQDLFADSATYKSPTRKRIGDLARFAFRNSGQVEDITEALRPLNGSAHLATSSEKIHGDGLPSHVDIKRSAS